MLDNIKAFLSSKKAVVFLAGLLLVVLQPAIAKLGLPLTEDHLVWVVTLVVGYLGGQGLADFGKAAAELAAYDEEDE